MTVRMESGPGCATAEPRTAASIDPTPAHRRGGQSPRGTTPIAVSVALGIAGGVLGGAAMNAFSRLVTWATRGREADGAAPGRARVGRGMQPPQAQGPAEDDGAVRLGSLVYRSATGHAPDRTLRLRLGAFAHYGFAAAVGVSYMLIAERVPVLRRGFGGVYGALVWMTADETLVPALGLSRGPRELTAGIHAYSLAGHWIYGATLEAVRRVATRRS